MCSLHENINDIASDYDTMQSNILCIQETYMTLTMQTEQFQCFNCLSNCNRHGMMILVKKNLTILEHIHFEEPNVEVLVARVIFKGFHIAIINIYVSPYAILTNIVNAIAKAL
jgi:exonuclease III